MELLLFSGFRLDLFGCGKSLNQGVFRCYENDVPMRRATC
jgi:hypothetical protein